MVVDVVNGFCTVGYGCAAPTEPKEQIETMVTESNRLAKTFTNRGLPVLAFLDTHEPGKPEREHVSFANLRQHPEGCGYTNEAR
ncbi:isochorismatase family protein [Microseira wollei]|nr:isochorismatase family protein [Microseira wollei]